VAAGSQHEWRKQANKNTGYLAQPPPCGVFLRPQVPAIRKGPVTQTRTLSISEVFQLRNWLCLRLEHWAWSHWQPSCMLAKQHPIYLPARSTSSRALYIGANLRRVAAINSVSVSTLFATTRRLTPYLQS
jgi:hypothetical protein